VAGKVTEEGIGSRAAPKHVLQERSVRNEKVGDGDIEVRRMRAEPSDFVKVGGKCVMRGR
jgi:hypothetical protein